MGLTSAFVCVVQNWYRMPAMGMGVKSELWRLLRREGQSIRREKNDKSKERNLFTLWKNNHNSVLSCQLFAHNRRSLKVSYKVRQLKVHSFCLDMRHQLLKS